MISNPDNPNLAIPEMAVQALLPGSLAKPRRGLQTDRAAVALAQAALARSAPVLDAHVAARHYLVSDTITLADYSVIPLESYRSGVPFDWSPYPRLAP